MLSDALSFFFTEVLLICISRVVPSCSVSFSLSSRISCAVAGVQTPPLSPCDAFSHVCVCVCLCVEGWEEEEEG